MYGFNILSFNYICETVGGGYSVSQIFTWVPLLLTYNQRIRMGIRIRRLLSEICKAYAIFLKKIGKKMKIQVKIFDSQKQN